MTDLTPKSPEAVPAPVQEAAPETTEVIPEPVQEHPPAPQPATAPVAPVAYPAVAPGAPVREVVFVQEPTPPAPARNRAFAAMITLLGAFAFTLLYFGAGAIIIANTTRVNVASTIQQFAGSDAFWIPVAAYAVIAILVALLVERAPWWVHVMTSVGVALLTYFGASLVVCLMHGAITMTPDAAGHLFRGVLANPFLIAALVLAREVSIWFGLAIAARGRRVRARNAAARAEFDRTLRERRAEYERALPA